jgi:Xaa-Pro aminopeptidase
MNMEAAPDLLTLGPPDLEAMRRYRLSRVQGQLRAADCPAIVLFQPQNIRYATDTRNMAIWTLYTPIRHCFVPADGLPVLFEFSVAHGDLPDELRGHVREVRPAKSWATMEVGGRKADAARAWADEIDELLRRRGGANRRIAFDNLDPVGLDAARRAGMEVVEGDSLMAFARLIKSEDEVRCIRQAVRVAERGMGDMEAALSAGLTENQLWAIFHKAMIEEGGEWIETRCLASGSRTNPWYLECCDKVIADGELVAFDSDMIGPYGYCADISRTWLCGDRPASDAQRRLFGLAHAQVHHNIELMRPGITYREVAERSWVPPEEFQTYQEAVGHGCGLQIEYPLLLPSARAGLLPYPDAELQAGMVLGVESYIGAVGGAEGVKLEQQILITDDGPRLFSDYPFEAALLG